MGGPSSSWLRPKLVLPVGHEYPLAEVVGRLHRARWHGVDVGQKVAQPGSAPRDSGRCDPGADEGAVIAVRFDEK